MDFSKVQSLAIYPAIGIARVGNSPKEYFIGPTIPGQHPQDPDHFRDAEGRIKRQGAQFFIFALDANGEILGELNDSHGVQIDWRVDIANKKAAWYNFDLAFDIPAANGAYDMDGNATPNGLPLLSQQRNLNYTGADRKKLMIEPRARHITGVNTNADGDKYHFDDGKINGQNVYLGELRTDELGRLIFLGGRGHSAAFEEDAAGNPVPLTTFANNQGWHDDTSDGPVDAKVTLPDGRTLNAEGAWVLTAPPNYAVGVQAFSTGYDLLLNVAQSFEGNNPFRQPDTEFFRDVYPMLQHLSINQWVNAGVSREFGWGSALDFNNTTLIDRLSDASEAARPFRQNIFNSFRNPDFQNMQPALWPPLYGDAITFNINSTDPYNWFAVTPLQYRHLMAWAEGHFSVGPLPTFRTWEDRSPTEQAHGLTEAALEETLGGPFHPGCEFTWPMRHAMVYHAPFRIKRRNNAQEDFGIALNPAIALGEGGPLDGSTPGDLTKWMATPWQSDTSSCLSAYRTYSGEYLPTFWPARVPNDVLTQEDFAIIENSTDDNERVAAFNPDRRKKWLRGFIYNNQGQIVGGSSISERMKGVEKFTKEWYKIGIILKQELQQSAPLFPKEVWVETGRFKDLDAPKLLTDPLSTEEITLALWVNINPRRLR
ncbi:MAG: LodA/GoxA family CTQ-dependent oxidase [Bacteroidota bacterium]